MNSKVIVKWTFKLEKSSSVKFISIIARVTYVLCRHVYLFDVGFNLNGMSNYIVFIQY